MADSIVLLEERKEVTTFLLDEGEIAATTVTTPTGETPGYSYSGDKIAVDDAVTLSQNSDIGKPTVKKYTNENEETILGIAINDPVTMSGGKRKTAILVLGHLFRLKLASGLSNIKVNDKIAITSTGAIKSDEGEYIAMHPVESSDSYNYIEVFRPYDIGWYLMLTKGNDTKVQNEVIAQTITDETAKRLKLARLFPKQEIQENSDYYTYFRQNINLDEAINKGLLGEAKDIAPGASLQELNIRKPITDTISIDTVGGVLNVNKDVFDSDIVSFEDLLGDVATVIANRIEYNIYDTLINSPNVPEFNTTQTEDTMEAYGQFVIEAQEAFKSSAGAGADLTIIAESYKTLSHVKQLAYSSNKLIQPVEAIKEYYGIDNIDLLGTTQADGGSLIGDKQYIGFDLRNSPLTVLYSKSSGTTTAPITSDDNIADFYPIIEIMRKDIYDELPQYTKLFIESKVGILLNKPNLALKGTCRP